MRYPLTAATVGLAILLVAGMAAQAQPASTGEAVFAFVRPYLVELASIAITALVAWITAIVRRKAGIDIDARHREALQTALTNAAGLVIAKVGRTAATLGPQSPPVMEGLQYVLEAAPDALAHFGLSAPDLGDKLRAKIGLITAGVPAPRA